VAENGQQVHSKCNLLHAPHQWSDEVVQLVAEAAANRAISGADNTSSKPCSATSAPNARPSASWQFLAAEVARWRPLIHGAGAFAD
jgi:hypothetical protein